MSASLTSGTESDFVCDCAEWMRSACAGEPFHREHEGKRYCVLHYPGKEKNTDFEKALQRKLENKDFDFRGVWFPDGTPFGGFDFSGYANFNSATFSVAANFNSATFSAVVDFFQTTFSGGANFSFAIFSAAADFVKATFSGGADFNSATFGAEADFLQATFSAEADFRSATFSAEADFRSATFSAEADFRSAFFSADVNFSGATFADHVRFAGRSEENLSWPGFTSTSQLDLQFIRVETADHVSFHTVVLRPHWFVNVDARKFDFTNVEWAWGTIDEEIESLEQRRVSSPYRLLAIACRHLAVNAEENHRYEEASKFRYMAMDVRRRETWHGLDFRRLSWWYWLASGYGERALRAFLVLLGIWFVAGLLYACVGFARWEPKLAGESDIVAARRDEVGAPLRFSRALTYSAGVMTLQKPEPRPATTAAQTIVLLETILGPVQAALLALAIRRKFMR